MVAGPGDLDEAQIALEHDHLGHRGDPGEAEPGRRLALGHLAGAAETRLLGMLDDELVELRA